MLQQKLAPLKSFRQILADGLFDHSGARKTNECKRFSNDDIAETRKTRRYTTGRRVGENRDVGYPLPALPSRRAPGRVRGGGSVLRALGHGEFPARRPVGSASIPHSRRPARPPPVVSGGPPVVLGEGVDRSVAPCDYGGKSAGMS